MAKARDHGGGLDDAVRSFGGTRDDWLDLSTGINPEPYPVADLSAKVWTALPDTDAARALDLAARAFWRVPDRADVLAAPGASSLIAKIPSLAPTGEVQIKGPTYNEHAAAFTEHGWVVTDDDATARVVVHPNNPDGRLAAGPGDHKLSVIDESFCDVCPDKSHIMQSYRPGVLVLKSFGKFWGLAGMRLGFAIGDPALVAKLRRALGPWPVSGPALAIGARALNDTSWTDISRVRLEKDAERLDKMMLAKGARFVGGTTLFRLYDVDDALAWHSKLAQHHIWSRIFPYSKTWLRLGLPPAHGWDRLEAAL